jgi:hypothetical protein
MHPMSVVAHLGYRWSLYMSVRSVRIGRCVLCVLCVRTVRSVRMGTCFGHYFGQLRTHDIASELRFGSIRTLRTVRTRNTWVATQSGCGQCPNQCPKLSEFVSETHLIGTTLDRMKLPRPALTSAPSATSRRRYFPAVSPSRSSAFATSAGATGSLHPQTC